MEHWEHWLLLIVHLQPSQVHQSVSEWLLAGARAGASTQYSVVQDPPRKVAMTVAAMVARQMRENQEKKDVPNSNWTEEERSLYELQQKSKSKLKVTAGHDYKI